MRLTRRQTTRRELLLIAGAAALAGCRGPGSAATHPRIAAPAFPPALGDPFMALTLPATLVLDAIYDSLTLLGEAGTAQPALAERWTRLDDRRWRFELRRGAVFSNGRPVTAEAVAEVFALLAAPRGRRTSAGSDLSMVDTAEARGETTIDILLSRPAPLLPAALSVLRIPEPAAYRRLGADAFAAEPVGSGPFAVDRWRQGNIMLRARPHPWRQARSSQLEVLLTKDRTARLQAVLSGTADVGMEISPDDAATVAAANGQVVSRMTTSVLVLNFITNEPGPLTDVRVREALNLAVDRRKLIDAFLRGQTRPATQLASDDGFGHDPTLSDIPHDPGRARQLLQDAGMGSGIALTLVAAVGASASDSAVFQQIAADLREIGVRLKIRRVPPATIRQHLYHGDWPGDMFAFRTGGFDALRSFRLASCDWIAPWRCYPEVESAIDRARSAVDRKQRELAIRRLLRLDRKQWSALYLWQEPSFDAVGSGVSGWEPLRATIPLEHLSA